MAVVETSAAEARAGLPMSKTRPARILLWTVLFIGGMLMITPILFMFSTSLKSAGPINDLSLIPQKPS